VILLIEEYVRESDREENKEMPMTGHHH